MNKSISFLAFTTAWAMLVSMLVIFLASSYMHYAGYAEVSLSIFEFLLFFSALFFVIFVGFYISFDRFLNRVVNLSASKCALELDDILQNKQFSLRVSDKKNKVDQIWASGINKLLEVLEDEVDRRLTMAKLRLEDQLEKGRLVQYDKLTGMPNRFYFTQTLQHELELAKKDLRNPALILIDILEFKVVNDVYGILAGDQLLVAVSKRISERSANLGIAARLSSDEFLIWIHNPKSLKELNSFAKELMLHLTAPYQIDQWSIEIQVSCGITLASDANYGVSESLANADLTQQHAKLSPDISHAMFAPYMKSEKLREQQIAAAIQSGINDNEFSINYQARLDNTCLVAGYEALVRWHSSELGELDPSEFIPIAEKSGKIRLITMWVINQVFSDIAMLVSLHREHVKVSINLSAIDLKASSLVNDIESKLLEHRISGKNVEFEITESSYLECFDKVNLVFSLLRNLGCALALDDFGTGYSSLSYLTKIKAGILKLDKQFVDELETSARGAVVIESIIQLAHQLNMKVCAEGVESFSQAKRLIEMGCDQLQGHYFCEPQPIDIHKKGEALLNQSSYHRLVVHN